MRNGPRATEEEIEAATVLQAHTRGLLARRSVSKLRRESKEAEAAAKAERKAERARKRAKSLSKATAKAEALAAAAAATEEATDLYAPTGNPVSVKGTPPPERKEAVVPQVWATL